MKGLVDTTADNKISKTQSTKELKQLVKEPKQLVKTSKLLIKNPKQDEEMGTCW
ncbi:hypothetical protein PI124_g5321 [Phytophthora idaei]|nr:hypothetical protein PI125_g4773 [Phytophthora idaei]KAG3172924.1 hypothetical protein PI126_g1100 [Phytophthora idaei]KAG3250041.1 hypothetical protein PI124_g5321 [Phytophthora idaei]